MNGYDDRFDKIIRCLLKYNRMQEINIQNLARDSIDLAKLILNAKVLSLRHQIPLDSNLRKLQYKNPQTKALKISQYHDDQGVSLLDIMRSAKDFESLEITDQCFVHLDNMHQKILKTLKSFKLINSQALVQSPQYQCNIFEHMLQLRELNFPFQSIEEIEKITFIDLPHLQHLQTLTLTFMKQSYVTVSLQSIINRMQAVSDSNQSLKDVQIEMNETHVLYQNINDTPELIDMSLSECLRKMGTQNEMEIKCQKNDANWIEVRMKFIEAKWTIMTENLNINYCL